MPRVITAAIMRAMSSLSFAVFAQQDQERQENVDAVYEGPKIIERAVSGVHVCTGLTDGQPCGEDRWTMTVHTDGTRTLRSFLNQTSQGTQINLVLRAEADTFRPIDAYANVYSQGAFYGTGLYVVDGDKLHVTVNGAEENFTETIDLPEKFTLLLHPISADGWHYGAGYDLTKGGMQMHNLCTLGAAGRSVHCAVYPIGLEFLGMETLTVPAGTFNTEHYKFGKDTEVWITGPDRIMIQHEYRVRQSRYQLVEIDGDF